MYLGRRPKSFGLKKREAPLQLGRLLDSSLRQALGGVTVGRRSAAEIARRWAAAAAGPGVGRKHMAWPCRSVSKLLAIALSPNHV